MKSSGASSMVMDLEQCSQCLRTTCCEVMRAWVGCRQTQQHKGPQCPVRVPVVHTGRNLQLGVRTVQRTRARMRHTAILKATGEQGARTVILRAVVQRVLKVYTRERRATGRAVELADSCSERCTPHSR